MNESKRPTAPRGPTTLYLMCGLAFAGKTTLAEAIAAATEAHLVSVDEINARRGLAGGLGIPEEEWARTHRQALADTEEALSRGVVVVVDDTNCYRFLRDNYRAVAERHGAPTRVVYLDVPLSLALARMRANEVEATRPPVRERVLRELARRFEPPTPEESVLRFPPGADPRSWVDLHIAPTIPGVAVEDP
jgi:predicted kinase